MTFKKTLVTLVAAAGIGLAAVACSQPQIQKLEDLTGDSIPDAIVNIKYGWQAGTWLFIGQKDGSFVRAGQKDNNGVKYFRTDKGETYFFDGQFYKLSPKQK